MTISDKKLAANRRNARKGGRPTKAFDAETNRLAQEVLQRADSRKVKMVARKLLKAIEEGKVQAPATPTVSAKATGLESLVAELLDYAAAKSLGEVQWQQIYQFCKREDIDGSPRRTELFLKWQQAQPMPELPD